MEERRVPGPGEFVDGLVGGAVTRGSCPARRYGVGMASPVGTPTPASSLPPQGASPRAIHDSLTISEDRAAFDREYKRALVTAAETMELAGVHAMLEQWRRRAWVTHDLEVYQRMMDRVDRLRRGEDVSSVPVEEVRAVIRERLGL